VVPHLPRDLGQRDPHFRHGLSHPPKDYLARSPMCFKCIRFRKNALKERSALFNWLNSYLNPMFNRVRDSLLTVEELDNAGALARRAADRDFLDFTQ